MSEAVIIDSIRTPIGNLNGSLSTVRPDDLAAAVLAALISRSQLDPAKIDEVYLGCANQAGEDNRNVARMALLLAGLPVDVPGLTVNRLCASGLAAVNLAARSIRSGDCQAILAGGVESMTRAPFTFMKQGSGNFTVYDTSLGWRFVNPRMETLYGSEPMGLTAENVAAQFGISRLEQDQFALESHQRALAAQDAGRFSDEILPVAIPQRKGEPLIFDRDEHPRRDSTLEALSALRPAFKPGGTVTAGNSSGLNDGAAGLVLMEEKFAIAQVAQPLARVVASASAGVHPSVMGLGPIPAVRKALAAARLTLADISLIELNEAFAAQSLAVIRELDLPREITNVNGGAIALGHPLGCSGARILTTLLHEMARRAPTAPRPFYGLATLCVGVGQGEATIVEWLD
jgi:3-oxoadipyl-CoA thiolase